MQDVQITPDERGVFDLSLDGQGIASVDGLQTTLEVTLFTDSRAPESLVPDAKNRRGWVGDILTALEERFTGSNLWLLDQARLTARTISQAEIYANDAFLYLVEDSIASEYKISIDRSNRAIDINIEYIISDNIIERYNILWRRTSVTGLSNI